jgi:hypothetical protein
MTRSGTYSSRFLFCFGHGVRYENMNKRQTTQAHCCGHHPRTVGITAGLVMLGSTPLVVVVALP